MYQLGRQRLAATGQLSRSLQRLTFTSSSRSNAPNTPQQTNPSSLPQRSTTDNPVPVHDPAPKAPVQNVSETNALATSSTGTRDVVLEETPEEAEKMRSMQAPNRSGVWSRSQRPRREAMVGPRFEQAIMNDQPRPWSAMELIHRQPVRWTEKRVVSCDGGGGPLGHPRIFINVDKPQICWCTYCGVPFVSSLSGWV